MVKKYSKDILYKKLFITADIVLYLDILGQQDRGLWMIKT